MPVLNTLSPNLLKSRKSLAAYSFFHNFLDKLIFATILAAFIGVPLIIAPFTLLGCILINFYD